MKQRVVGSLDDISEIRLVEKDLGKPQGRYSRGEEAQRGVRRRVRINQEHAAVEPHQGCCQIDGGRALTAPSFGVGPRDSSPRSPLPRRQLLSFERLNP